MWFLGLNAAVFLGIAGYLAERSGALPLGAAASEAKEWIGELDPTRERQPAVIVVLTRSQNQLHQLRRKLGRAHIAANYERAFALRGGSVIASNLEAASKPINAMGWSNRRLEIVSQELPIPKETAASALPNPAETQAVIQSLAKKDTLTRSEAMLLLDHLE